MSDSHNLTPAPTIHGELQVDVISDRLDWDDLFHISTLHSFLWSQISRFTSSLRESLRNYHIPTQIEKKKQDDNGGESKKAIAAREKVRFLESTLDNLDAVEKFNYSDSTFSDYSQGQLNHDDIIDLAANMICENEILRQVIGQKFPYIFVDEAQDTFENVVEAINSVCKEDGLPIVGYFGDPMQQIFEKRAGNFAGPATSALITKRENYRCSKKVINLLNSLRVDVRQFPAGKNTKIEGSVLLRLVRAETPEGKRKKYTEDQIQRASARFDEAMKHWGWLENSNVKQLFLVRQMIARRLGFPNLQKLFTGKYASAKAQEDYEKGEHFLIKPFVDSLCHLVQSQRDGDMRRVIDILRKSSPAFDPEGVNAKLSLTKMNEKSATLTKMLSHLWDNNTVGDILKFCLENDVCKISDRLSEHLTRPPRDEEYNQDLHVIDKGEWLVDEFLKMTSVEIAPLVNFVSENTPFSTQHGVKGEEYKDVLVVFDDIEAAWNNYSFTKSLTPNTSGEPTEGQYERTRKLAYVCFSRAEENLRILLFTPTPEAARDELISRKLFNEDQISIAE